MANDLYDDDDDHLTEENLDDSEAMTIITWIIIGSLILVILAICGGCGA